MNRFSVVAGTCLVLLALTTVTAFAEPGKPIEGTDVGLDHTPPPGGGIYAHARTNDTGDITFSNLKPGTYTFELLDSSRLKVPCRMVIASGREKLLPSEPIRPGKRGVRAYALDASGHKLSLVIDKPGVSITVHLQTDK